MSTELQEQASLTPKEVEERELRQLEQTLVNTEDPVEYAAAMFSMYWERFHTLCNKMSAKELKRIILKNVLEPLEDSGYEYQTDKEADCGNLMRALMDARALMVLHSGVQEQFKQANLETAQESTEETTAVDNKENNNG